MKPDQFDALFRAHDLQKGAEQERRRIVGLVLAEYARYKLAGHLAIADALDILATDIEHLSSS